MRALGLALVLFAGTAAARTPPIAGDPRGGTWLGAGERYVLQSRDQWTVFTAGATVNKLSADGAVLWIATDDGAIRLDTESRGTTRFGLEDGLPSQSVTAVAVDERFVWFATNKGLARYRKLDRTWRVFSEADGLPHRAVNDLLVVGRQVWLGTRGGLALYDADVDGVRAVEGLAETDVAELFLVGEDVWSRTDRGLARFRPRTRTLSTFSYADLGGEELRALAVDGARLWLGTEKGLFSFETTSDTFVPFPQQSSLQSASIRGLELLSDYLFIITDAEVVQFHKNNRSMRRFSEADGLVWHEGVQGSVLSGGVLTVLFADGASTYQVQREVWHFRSLEPKEEGSRTRARLFGRLNAEVPFNARTWEADEQRFSTAEGGFGLSHVTQSGQVLDASGRLDYGQLELPGIRDLTARLTYQGRKDDVVREVEAEDRYLYRTLEEGLERPLALRGGQLRVATKGEQPLVSSSVAGGLRRGLSVRDFFTGAQTSVLPLSNRYVLPGSERVYVDGELLTNGTDYTVIYPAGQLAFLDLERVDELSVIEIEYEVDLQPRKGLGVLSLLDLLPADREVGDWTRSGEARLVSEETGLYAQIDGAAPRYLDRGWVKSVFSEYRQGGRTLQVSVHDLGSEANARALFDFDLPPARESIDGREDAVLDLGLATSYAVRAVIGTYYLELSIDEKSDAARESLKLFTLQILDRGTGAGANQPGMSPEWLTGLRVASAPISGLETGVRLLRSGGTGTGPGRELLTTVGDARFERPVGAGLLTAYGELAGSFGQGVDDPDGMGAIGRLRLAHPYLDGALSYRHHSDGYRSLGTSDTRFGRLSDEARLQATAYPARWLPTSGFFTRAISFTEDGLPGIEQHTQGRLQLSREGLPTASAQLGHSLLEGAGTYTGRLKAVGQLDYDLAQGPLAFTKMKRFGVRALYSFSQADVDEGAGPREDQVRLLRLEGRIAPNSTESAWAVFRHRQLEQRLDLAEPFSLGGLRWEVNSGARSAIIPGLVPQVSYVASRDDDRVAQPISVRSARAVTAGSLAVLPGAWWAALSPLLIEPRVSVAGEQSAEGSLRTGQEQVLRLDNRAIWAGHGKVDVELLELYEESRGGQEQAVGARKLELRNRVVFRPRPTMPLTARFNFTRQETANDLTLVPTAPPFGAQLGWEGALEWLRRWNPNFTSMVRGVYGRSDTQGLVQPGPTGQGGVLQEFRQHRLGGELELRAYRTSEASNLFVVQRNRAYRLFGTGEGATEAVALDLAGGVVWALGDKLYLDGEVAWRQTVCLDSRCVASRELAPRVLLSVDL